MVLEVMGGRDEKIGRGLGISAKKHGY